jgi:hypothetical protein
MQMAKTCFVESFSIPEANQSMIHLPPSAHVTHVHRRARRATRTSTFLKAA